MERTVAGVLAAGWLAEVGGRKAASGAMVAVAAWESEAWVTGVVLAAVGATATSPSPRAQAPEAQTRHSHILCC